MNKRFNLWMDGGCRLPDPTALKPVAEKPRTDKSADSERESRQMRCFTRIYSVFSIALVLALAVALFITVCAMPPFGWEGNPTNNEVVEHYVSNAQEETGAHNVIAGMILNYRGFDTFGESCVLFISVCCVMMLLWDSDGSERESGVLELDREDELDSILDTLARLLIPCALVFGVCVLFNGHSSPGGGFSGGSVLGGALILFAVAFGQDSIKCFFTRGVFNTIRISGLLIYAGMFGLYIILGANGIESELSKYIVKVIDIAVGLVVMSTMYGFYSFYTKGDI